MAVGGMRHKLQLQSKYVTPDGGGSDELTSWSTFANVFGSIVAESGGERMFGEQLQEPITHKIRIRFRRDISFKNRIQYKFTNEGISVTRVFNIKRVINVENRDRYIEIMCVEGVAT
tara:strand:+ start:2492 stop:2842 length:351 start_codon:yes stop_codon:yes gene_type:complete